MYQRLGKLFSAVAIALTIACAQTDTGISTAVKSKLAADDTVKAYQIDVDTADKVVTLSGSVDSAAAKQQATLIARNTDGVREVIDRITVEPRGAATTGDLRDEARDVEREAREAGGEAARETRDAADAAGDRTQAVVGDAAITSAVKAKLLADTTVSGLKIDVDTRDGVVTLNGTVNTRAEGERAVALARETDGVRRVVNNTKMGR